MKPVVLTILDGVGLSENSLGNAFKNANKPNFEYLWNNYPHTTIEASGEVVGLPIGQMGNSEVGHLNIGAGRIVYQPLQLINNKIKNQEFFNNEQILEVMNHVKKNNSKLHIFGLLSDGGIHSHINHLLALIDMCKKENIDNVYYHLFTDGRDTSPKSSKKYFEILDNKIKETKIGEIATISGRFYAMDRDNRWERIKLAYDAIVNKIGEHYLSYAEAIDHNYSLDITDEFIKPAVLSENGNIEDNDGLIVFNYRPDRLRELFYAITNPNFKELEVKKFNNIKLVTMMKVSDDVITTNAFKLDELKNTLGDYVSSKGLKQLRIAETEKYAHVTYFFDGGLDKEIPGCTRILIPSPKVATYDLKPEMSAYEVTEKLLENIDKVDLVILNFANGDMVGHTGNYEAAVKAVETLDVCLGKIIAKLKELNGAMIVTADHGNCEVMIDESGNPMTAHTTNLVPLIVFNANVKSLRKGILADVAPTLLELLELTKPEEMTGESLIIKE